MPPLSSGSRQKADICFQCRNRKVRCGGGVDGSGCQNCRSLAFDCSLSVLSDADDPQNRVRRKHRLERRRTRRACQRCRLRKTKCSGDVPTCDLCRHGEHRCIYLAEAIVGTDFSIRSNEDTNEERTRRSDADPGANAAIAHSLTVPDAVSCGMLSTHVVNQHIDAFFQFIHPIPSFNFVHRASLLHSWSRKAHSTLLIKVICGISNRFISSGCDAQEVTARWIEEAEVEALFRLEQPVMSDIEALMLLTLNLSISRKFAKMLVYSAFVARLTYVKRLNYEDEAIDFVSQERRRRLMWCIFVFDTFYSNGRKELYVCPRDSIAVQLPCDEESFAHEVPVLAQTLRMQTSTGIERPLSLAASLVRILDVRDRIQRLAVSITHHREPLRECLGKVRLLEQELEAFEQSTATKYAFNDRTLFLHTFSAELTPFVMLKLWYHQCHCDLYRFAISGLREALPTQDINKLPTEFITHCKQECLTHALANSAVMAAVMKLNKDIMISDPCLAMCAFHTARVIARLGLSTTGRLTQEAVYEALSACHAILERPATFYPTAKILRRGVHDLMRAGQVRSDSTGNIAMGRNESPLASHRDTPSPGPPDATPQGPRRPGLQQVYSKYSIVDEINRFPQESFWTQGRQPFVTTDQTQVQPAQTQRQPSPQALLTAQTPMSMWSGGIAQPDFAQLGASASILDAPNDQYSMLMTLGFDASQQNVNQPDSFMDWFLPLDTSWPPSDMVYS